MAACASPAFSVIDGKASLKQPHCTRLPPILSRKTTLSYYRRTARNVIAMATGETQVVISSDSVPTTGPPVIAPADEPASDVPKIVKTVQAAWDKVEDKYAVSYLAVVGIVVLWGSTGLVAAIDKLPLLPGVFELVGIAFTGWFVYQNLIFKPDREALVEKVKDTYNEIIGSS